MEIDKNPLGIPTDQPSKNSPEERATKDVGDFLDFYEKLIGSYAEYMKFVGVVKDLRRETDMAEQKYVCRRLQAKLMLDHGIGSQERARALVQEADQDLARVGKEELGQKEREAKTAAMLERLQDGEAELRKFRRQLGV